MDRLEPSPSALLNAEQVAELLGITPRSVRRLADAGELPRIRLGRRTCRYAPADVEALIERHVVTPDNSESAPQGAPAKGDDGAPRREG